MKHVMLWVLFIVSVSVNAEPIQGRVATALPIGHALTEQLLKGTSIEAIYLPPKRYPVTRLNYWLQHKSSKVMAKQKPFDAVITAEALWPEYALYSVVRKHSIRVVPIDLTHDLDLGGAKILSKQSEQLEYFWLDPSNLLVMGQILAKDLARLWPAFAPTIRKNLVELEANVRQYSINVDELLMNAGISAVCLEQAHLAPLASSTFLPINKGLECEIDDLRLQTSGKKKPGGQKVWLINQANKPLKVSLAQWLRANQKALANALNQGGS